MALSAHFRGAGRNASVTVARALRNSILHLLRVKPIRRDDLGGAQNAPQIGRSIQGLSHVRAPLYVQVALVATLSSVGTIPVAAIGLLLGIERFMGEARAVTSFTGNAVAAVFIAKWQGKLDLARARSVLNPQALKPTPETPAPAPLPVELAAGSTARGYRAQ